MKPIDPNAGAIETILAATLYLMSQHRCPGGQQTAPHVAPHVAECVARHPQATPVIGDVCLSLYESWSRAACHPADTLH